MYFNSVLVTSLIKLSNCSKSKAATFLPLILPNEKFRFYFVYGTVSHLRCIIVFASLVTNILYISSDQFFNARGEQGAATSPESLVHT